jgi:hypothetical protein
MSGKSTERIMKTIVAVCLGVMVTLSAGAADEARARLVGQRMVQSAAQSPILVCQYRTAAARYEVVAAKASCAPYLALGEPASAARELAVTVARTSTP